MKTAKKFDSYIEIGRIACISYGKGVRKLCAIVEVIDDKRVLVDGPCTGVERQVILVKKLMLSNVKLKFLFSPSTNFLKSTWEKRKITELFPMKKVTSQKSLCNCKDLSHLKKVVGMLYTDKACKEFASLVEWTCNKSPSLVNYENLKMERPQELIRYMEEQYFHEYSNFKYKGSCYHCNTFDKKYM